MLYIDSIGRIQIQMLLSPSWGGGVGGGTGKLPNSHAKALHILLLSWMFS